MLIYPQIDPVAFHVWTWPVYWYGLMYLLGFLLGWFVLGIQARFSPRGFNADQLSDIVFFTALGAIIGGRVGYMQGFVSSLNVSVATGVLLFEAARQRASSTKDSGHSF